MPFSEVPLKPDFVSQEHDILRLWKETDAFRKMTARHKGQPRWSFIDGPITANNPMGVHHGWGRSYKDAMLRFRTMQGHELRYQNGFDCQGLWVEVNVERELGFRSKKDIEDFGLARFVLKCKERVLRYAAVQTEQSMRLGYWMDWNDPDVLRELADKLVEDPAQQVTLQGPEGEVSGSAEQVVARLGLPELGGSYFTFSDENNFMIWGFLKKCWENGWVYRGDDVMPWCPRCATAISQHEIATEGYRELAHDSVTVRFPLRDRTVDPGKKPPKRPRARKADAARDLPQHLRAEGEGGKESLLVWTTTPWTLSSNVAAAVGPELTYLKVRQGDETLYLSKGALHMLRGDYEVLGELKGAEMVGWTYDGPFDELPAAGEPGGHTALVQLIRDIPQSAREAHQVIAWEAVGEAEGTGIVHIAPGCGAEDFQLGREYRLPMVAPLSEEGVFLEGFGWLTGRHVSEVAAPIFDDLRGKGLLYNVESYTHRYPVCWRCGTELVFRLVDEWFISMGPVYETPREQLTPEQKSGSLRYQIMDVVEQIRWIPEFGLRREMDWLRNMHDWMISKKRYWGLALPIWECGSCGHFEVLGSEQELRERATEGLEVLEGHTPHRPFIDAVKLACPQCGGSMSRVRDVGNPWLDAGIVPFSTMSFRADPEYWRAWYPAAWISESFPGQFRNWFYSLLTMATVLSGEPPFLQNFGYATLLAEDGQAMHKSSGNAIEFNDAADRMGVDVMRWLFFSQPPENDLLFGYHRADDTRRQFLIPLWNVYSFFVTYARLDGWLPSERGFAPDFPEGVTPGSANLLDRWICARLDEATRDVTEAMEASDFMAVTVVVDRLIDDLTNWYVRRSRRRFWKSEADVDKNAAYATLYYVLVKLGRLLAPFVPFVSEVMYQNLVRAVQPTAAKSVHHTAWPGIDEDAIGEGLIEQMSLARRITSLGMSARAGTSLKVRQPLSRVLVYPESVRLSDEMAGIVLDELNVKEIEYVQDSQRLVTYRVLPNNKLLGPRWGARFPQLRAALEGADAALVAASVRDGTPLRLEVDGEPVELLPEEILVSTQPAAGLAVAADKLITVAVDATVTPELRAEGQAREIVRRVQDMRKNAGFEIADRITLYYQAQQGLKAVLQQWEAYIRLETLSTEWLESAPPEDAYVEEHKIDGESLTIGVRRNAVVSS